MDRDTLDGYWKREGERFVYFAYRDAVDAFVARYGTYPAAAATLRAARKTRRPTGPAVSAPADDDVQQKLDELVAGQAAILEAMRKQGALVDVAQRRAAEQESRVLVLEDAVRRLATANESLRAAVEDQEVAADHLRRADEARSRALRNVAKAGDEHASIAASLHVPDLPPG